MLCDRIKELRIALGFTQSEFAEIIGVSHGSVSDWENGKSKPKGASLIAIEYKYNVNPEWLINGQGSMFKPEATIDLGSELKRIITWMKRLSPQEQAWLDIEMQDKIKKYKEWLEKN